MNVEEIFMEGCRLLELPLVSAGFKFISGPAARSSGGHFASGEYVRDGRKLRLHFRHSLGLVTYQFRGLTASHESVLRALGVFGRHQYPGFSDDPLDGFRHLRSDLDSFLQVFISGLDEELGRLLTAAIQEEAKSPKGINGIP